MTIKHLGCAFVLLGLSIGSVLPASAADGKIFSGAACRRAYVTDDATTFTSPTGTLSNFQNSRYSAGYFCPIARDSMGSHLRWATVSVYNSQYSANKTFQCRLQITSWDGNGGWTGSTRTSTANGSRMINVGGNSWPWWDASYGIHCWVPYGGRINSYRTEEN